MKKILLPFAMIGVLALTACPPPEETTDAGPAADAAQTDANTDGCNRPTGAARGLSCTADEDCRCGLSCVKIAGETQGVCMEKCTSENDCEVPTPICGVGSIAEVQSAHDIPTYTDQMCVGELNQFEDCFTALSACGEGMSCDAAVSDDENDDGLPDYFACQTQCSLGDDSPCPNGQECVANNAGYYQLQANATGTEAVSCTLEQCPGDECPCADTYACIDFAEPTGTACGKLAGMCGVQASTVIATDDYIDGNVTQDVYCDSMQGVGCDVTLGGVDNPAMVMCYTGIFSDAPQAGICLSICGMPVDGQAEYELSDCPEGMVCDTENGLFMDVQTDANHENVACTMDADAGVGDDTNCNTELGYHCEALVSGSFCARPYGSCNWPHSAEDAGVSEDAGTVAEDAGTVVEDAGTTVEDAGTVVEDSGTTVEDSGSEDVAN